MCGEGWLTFQSRIYVTVAVSQHRHRLTLQSHLCPPWQVSTCYLCGPPSRAVLPGLFLSYYQKGSWESKGVLHFSKIFFLFLNNNQRNFWSRGNCTTGSCQQIYDRKPMKTPSLGSKISVGFLLYRDRWRQRSAWYNKFWKAGVSQYAAEER